MSAEPIDGHYDLGSTTDVPIGTVKGYALAGRRIVVANIDGRFVGFDELCPHLSIPLSQGSLSEDCLTCVGHGSVFELPSGKVQKWMGRRPGLISSLLSGKPMPIAPFPIEVVDGRLRIDDTDRPTTQPTSTTQPNTGGTTT